MTKLFMPTDRIGLESYQKSIANNFSTVNELLKKGLAPQWHVNGVRFESTPAWPEGHCYQCGFSVDDSSAARSVFDEKGIIYEEVEMVPSKGQIIKKLKAAVYNGRGAGEDFSAPLLEVLEWGGFNYDFVGDADIRGGKLNDFDVMIVPGSPDAGECYYAGLGDRGYDAIRSFIADRGHYLGVCGGAYLPLTSYNTENRYWLNIVAATETEDLDYWRSGSGFVRCRIEDNKHHLFAGIALGVSSTMNLVYWEGPSITIRGGNVKSLARFESLLASGRDPIKPYWEMYDNKMAEDAVRGWYNPLTPEIFASLLHGKTAFAEAESNGHKLLLFSPHPEMGNIGYGPRKDSLNFLLIYNGLTYLACQ